jgi:phosphoglycolate phosphatase
MKPSITLFDLDGTLIDSMPGIVHSLRLTLHECGVDVADDFDFKPHIGSSLWHIFETFLETTDKVQLDRAVALYRHIYRDGPMFEFDVYDGVVASLEKLANEGSKVVIATAKAHEYAREVVNSTVFSKYISHVYGSELDGTNVQKADLIKHVLHEEKLQAAQAIMVGDRHHDISGALANGVASIGVTYGYGDAEELAGATALIDSATKLFDTIVDLRSIDR